MTYDVQLAWNASTILRIGTESVLDSTLTFIGMQTFIHVMHVYSKFYSDIVFILKICCILPGNV